MISVNLHVLKTAYTSSNLLVVNPWNGQCNIIYYLNPRNYSMCKLLKILSVAIIIISELCGICSGDAAFYWVCILIVRVSVNCDARFEQKLSGQVISCTVISDMCHDSYPSPETVYGCWSCLNVVHFVLPPLLSISNEFMYILRYFYIIVPSLFYRLIWIFAIYTAF